MFIEPPAQPGISGTVETLKQREKRGPYKRGPAKKERYIIHENLRSVTLISELRLGKKYVEAARLDVQSSAKYHGHIRRVMNLVKNEKLAFGEGEKYLRRCYGERQVKVS